MCPGGGAVGLPEALEQPRKHRWLDAGTVVADGQTHVFPDARQPHCDSTAAWRELDRVGEKVPHHLLEALGIARDGAHLRAKPGFEEDAFCLGCRPHRVDRRLDHRVERERSDVQSKLARDRARDIEEILDDPLLQLGIPLDRAQGTFPRRGIEVSLAEQQRPAEDRHEGSPELVGHDGEELVLGPVGGGQLVGQGRQVTALARERALQHVAGALQHDEVGYPCAQLLGGEGLGEKVLRPLAE